MKIRNAFKKIWFTRKGQSSDSPEKLEELRAAFKARYHHFKLLLNANNKALELMSEMEKGLRADRLFSMSLIRAWCTSISTNVFQIVKNLNELSPDKYVKLFVRFKDIQEHINLFIQTEHITAEGPLVISLRDVDKNQLDLVGNKMALLGEIGNWFHRQYLVPDGFVVTARGYHRFLEANDLPTEINRRIQASNVKQFDEACKLSSSLRELIQDASVPADLEHDILQAVDRLSGPKSNMRFAVRSSALDEDMTGATFAGQYHSALNVPSDNLLQAYKEIVASKYSVQAMIYRLNHGIRDVDVPMCVGFLQMINAVAGGVVYSKNPVNAREEAVVINSVWGLPKAVVDGSMSTDFFLVSRSIPAIISYQDIPRKEQKLVCDPESGITLVPIPEDEQDASSISREQVIRLARMAVRVEEYFGHPQDIEWVIDGQDSIIFLQCRPLQIVASEFPIPPRHDQEILSGVVLHQGGVTASPGGASGPVFIVKRISEMPRVPDNSILVVSQALPMWAPLLNRVAAVVSEKGSITGHLANVAREYGIPALFGVSEATKILQPGAMITIQADTQFIYEGQVELPPVPDRKPTPVMTGSVVLETLKGVSQYIIPLNLLDPQSPQFRIKNCQTFHDITRYCHEKVVHEMFQFGLEHKFPERASKQLHCQVPMQFWVINLDDGFREDIPGSFVTLDNIVSIPMLALWQGMNAIPWGGPPPVDAKGFMSVLMEATTNPNLNPTQRSSFAVRNYFMISRHFLSVQSRFGFHFSTVEALVSERALENYISFQFKGGAADIERRIIRAHVVAEIVEEYDFQVDVKEDATFARIEGYEQDFMESRLKILGYLLIHTRQLDMVMSNNAAVQHHRAKMRNDLQTILNQKTDTYGDKEKS